MALTPETLKIARALDNERAAGKLSGPLRGIPVLLKDNMAADDHLREDVAKKTLLTGSGVVIAGQIEFRGRVGSD